MSQVQPQRLLERHPQKPEPFELPRPTQRAGVYGHHPAAAHELRHRFLGPTVVASEALANQSVKRLVESQEIAALTVFLASDHARSISGQMIPIDGDSKAAR